MARVRDAMLHRPKLCPAGASVAQVRDAFHDDHVHAVVLVDGDRLVAVVERPDLDGAQPTAAAREIVAGVEDRVIGPDADLPMVHQRMLGHRRRRLAVVDDAGRLLGLLCLKASGTGFCSDADVYSRAAERAACSGDVLEHDGEPLPHADADGRDAPAVPVAAQHLGEGAD